MPRLNWFWLRDRRRWKEARPREPCLAGEVTEEGSSWWVELPKPDDVEEWGGGTLELEVDGVDEDAELAAVRAWRRLVRRESSRSMFGGGVKQEGGAE